MRLLVHPCPMDVDAKAAAATIPSALPPPGFADAHYMVWTNGGYLLSAAVAGMQSARSQELRERIERREQADRARSQPPPARRRHRIRSS
jgi:hypothetical protein